MPEIVLTGLNGSNPLGFLATLGTLRILSDAIEVPVHISWRQLSCGWRPVLTWQDADEAWADPWLLSGTLACLLKVPATMPGQDQLRAVSALDESYRSAKKNLIELEKKLKKEAKDRGAKGAELLSFITAGCAAHRNIAESLRASWLASLKRVVISTELGLGKTLTVTNDEMRDLALQTARDSSQSQRLVADLVAGFGAEGHSQDEYIQPTDFCFVNGSGQQFFLDTVQKLMYLVTPEKMKRALFDSWTYDDQRFSMRWDPLDDRRYALMWSDPTSSGNEAKTMWAANLLAYYGLTLLPCFATGSRVHTTGFTFSPRVFSWGIWTTAISIDVVRSVLADAKLLTRPIDRSYFQAIGVTEVYESTRIQVGSPPLVKINFSQTRVV